MSRINVLKTISNMTQKMAEIDKNISDFRNNLPTYTCQEQEVSVELCVDGRINIKKFGGGEIRLTRTELETIIGFKEELLQKYEF